MQRYYRCLPNTRVHYRCLPNTQDYYRCLAERAAKKFRWQWKDLRLGFFHRFHSFVTNAPDVVPARARRRPISSTAGERTCCCKRYNSLDNEHKDQEKNWITLSIPRSAKRYYRTRWRILSPYCRQIRFIEESYSCTDEQSAATDQIMKQFFDIFFAA